MILLLKLAGVIFLTLGICFLLLVLVHKLMLEYEHFRWEHRWELNRKQREKWEKKR